MWITKGKQDVFKCLIFLFCVNIINYYYYYCSAGRGWGVSLIFLCSHVELAWNFRVCLSCSRTSKRNVQPERPPPHPHPRAQPRRCSPSGGTQLSCADSAILRSRSRSYLTKKQNKEKKTGIFLLLFAALRCHVVAMEAGRSHIDLWEGAGPSGRGHVGGAEQDELAGVTNE